MFASDITSMAMATPAPPPNIAESLMGHSEFAIIDSPLGEKPLPHAVHSWTVRRLRTNARQRGLGVGHWIAESHPTLVWPDAGYCTCEFRFFIVPSVGLILLKLPAASRRQQDRKPGTDTELRPAFGLHLVYAPHEQPSDIANQWRV
jgi:hypothetical protein